MPSWKAWVQRLSSISKVEGCASAFMGSYLSSGRECFIGTSIDNQSKSLSDRVFVIFTGKAGAYSGGLHSKDKLVAEMILKNTLAYCNSKLVLAIQRGFMQPSSQLFSIGPP
jgi:hypothetical protein